MTQIGHLLGVITELNAVGMDLGKVMMFLWASLGSFCERPILQH